MINIKNIRPTLIFTEYNISQNHKEVARLWQLLYSANSHSFFMSWDWFDTWISLLPSSLDIHLIVGFQDKTPVIGFFKCDSYKKIWGIPILKYSNINSTGLNEFDDLTIEYNALIGPSGANFDFPSLLKTRIFSRSDIIILPGLSEPPKGINQLSDLGFQLQLSTSSAYRVNLDLINQSIDGYLALLSKNKRAQIRRSNRLLSQTGELTVKKATTTEEAVAMFSSMVTLHQKSWVKRGESGAFANKFLLNFHKKLLLRCVNQSVGIYKISAGEKTIGYIYGFFSNEDFLYYQSGFIHEKSNQAKPGLSCHSLLIEHLAKQGLKTYDFLAGGSGYKESLSTHTSELSWIYIYRKSPIVFLMKIVKKLTLLRSN